MAFEYAGDLISGAMPVKRTFQAGADMWSGTLAAIDVATTTGGYVKNCPVAAAGPDTATRILGICTGVKTSPVYTSLYGDKTTYDTTQATLVANDPVGPALAEVTLITPTTLIKAPIWLTTPGTAPLCLAATTAVTDGLTFVTSGFAAAVDAFSTAYCRTGANRGQYRKVDGTGTTTQAFVIPWTYDVAIGDEFVVVNMVEGMAHVDLVGTYLNGLEGAAALSNYYKVYIHELNLETAGQEYAVFTIASDHLAIGAGI